MTVEQKMLTHEKRTLD